MLDLYTNAASTMLHGESPIGVAAMAYPPLLVATYIPFCELTSVVQRIAILGMMASLLVFIFSTIQTMIVGKQSLKSTIVFWCIVALVAGRYVSSPIENYSHDILIAALVVLAIRLWATCREGLGGAAIGVAAACKATPLLFLPYLLLQRRWKAAIVMSVVTVIAFMLPDVLFPRDGGTWSGYWLSLVSNSLNQVEGANIVGNWTGWNQLNQSIAGTVTRLFSLPTQWNKDAVNVCIVELSPAAIKAIVLGARVAVIAMLVFIMYKPTASSTVMRRFCEGSLLVCGMLLLSPMSSKAHFFLLLLPVSIIARYYIWEQRDKLLAVILLIMFVYGTLSVKDLIGIDAGHAVLATGSVTWCSLLAMLGTWRVMLKYQSAPDVSVSKKQ